MYLKEIKKDIERYKRSCYALGKEDRINTICPLFLFLAEEMHKLGVLIA